MDKTGGQYTETGACQESYQQNILTMLDHVHCGIILLNQNADGNVKIDYVNAPAFELLGYAPDSLDQAQKEEILLNLRIRNDACVVDLLKQAIRDGRTVDGNYRIRGADQKACWLHADLNRIAEAEGTDLRFVLTLNNIDAEMKVQEELRVRLEYDSLTGIYNREAFYRHTQEMLDNNPDVNYAIVTWDIERFKVINDLYGTQMGDRILRQLGKMSKEVVGACKGTYGRMDNDHFAICIPQSVLSPEAINLRMSQFSNRLNVDYEIAVSAGVYLIDDRGLSVAKMCDRANIALATIKGNYRTHFAFYNDEIRQHMVEEQILTAHMHQALETHEFEVYLQPIYSVLDDKPISAEALIRWNFPDKGVIPPSAFIPLFEHNGFIADLDTFVWEEVLRILHEREQQGFPSIPISVNASRRSLYSTTLANDITSLADRYQIPHSLFKIEITETAYTDNPEQLINIVKKLKSEGFPILMDDFGSGYSSFNTLKNIPFDTLKIDMKFLQGFEEGGKVGTILTSILRMAKWLDISVIAEGVETVQQTEFLHSIGCNWIQGYVYAHPMTVQEFNIMTRGQVHLTEAETGNSFSYKYIDGLMGGDAIVNLLMKSMPNGFAILERTEDIIEVVRVNDAYYQIIGQGPGVSSLNIVNSLDSFTDEDKVKLRHSCDTASQTRQLVRVSLQRRHQDGHFILLDCMLMFVCGSKEHAIFTMTFSEIPNSFPS